MRKKSEELKMGVFTVANTNFSEQLYSSVVVLQYVPTLNLVNKPLQHLSGPFTAQVLLF
jgi:hypothetical protein